MFEEFKRKMNGGVIMIDKRVCDWWVVEDGIGRVSLYVFERDTRDKIPCEEKKCIYVEKGFERDDMHEILLSSIACLKAGGHPVKDNWNSEIMLHEEFDPQVAYDVLCDNGGAWFVIATENGIKPENMGASGKLIFEV